MIDFANTLDEYMHTCKLLYDHKTVGTILGRVIK